jgi:hypothetical protein
VRLPGDALTVLGIVRCSGERTLQALGELIEQSSRTLVSQDGDETVEFLPRSGGGRVSAGFRRGRRKAMRPS